VADFCEALARAKKVKAVNSSAGAAKAKRRIHLDGEQTRDMAHFPHVAMVDALV
jgi:hypothetical protein